MLARLHFGSSFSNVLVSVLTKHGLPPIQPWAIRLLLHLSAMMLNAGWGHEWRRQCSPFPAGSCTFSKGWSSIHINSHLFLVHCSSLLVRSLSFLKHQLSLLTSSHLLLQRWSFCIQHQLSSSSVSWGAVLSNVAGTLTGTAHKLSVIPSFY